MFDHSPLSLLGRSLTFPLLGAHNSPLFLTTKTDEMFLQKPGWSSISKQNEVYLYAAKARKERSWLLDQTVAIRIG
jgi:hypothetical protein